MAFCLNVLNFFLDKVKFYDGRQTSWCAGNDALAEEGFQILFMGTRAPTIDAICLFLKPY